MTITFGIMKSGFKRMITEQQFSEWLYTVFSRCYIHLTESSPPRLLLGFSRQPFRMEIAFMITKCNLPVMIQGKMRH